MRREKTKGGVDLCYTVVLTPKFVKDLEYYEKRKKFKHVTSDVDDVVGELESGNLVGDVIPGLKIPNDNHTYKMRVANTDTKVGKSNGYRIIYYVIKDDKVVYLVTIYYKKDENNIPTNEQLVEWIEEYCMV